MRTFKDTRGKSWFDLVPEMDWQVDTTVNYPGTIRAFHLHRKKTEWMFIVEGEYRFVLTDPDDFVYLSQGEIIKIDPGRWHGYQVLGEKPGIIIEIADAKHNLEKPDDEREAWNKFSDWEKEKK